MSLGGPLMWPLLVCSILLGAVLVERLVTVGLRHKLLGGRMSTDRLAWHRRVLPFFTDVPPSVGLLGTVVGVVQCFQITGGGLDGQNFFTPDAPGLGLLKEILAAQPSLEEKPPSPLSPEKLEMLRSLGYVQ